MIKTWQEFTAGIHQNYGSEHNKFGAEKVLCNQYNAYIRQEFSQLNPQSPTYKEQRAKMAQVLFGGKAGAEPYQRANDKARAMGLLSANCDIPHEQFVATIIGLRETADRENLGEWGQNVGAIDAKKQQQKAQAKQPEREI